MEELLQTRLDAHAEKTIVYLEKYRAMCDFRHGVMKGRVKILGPDGTCDSPLILMIYINRFVSVCVRARPIVCADKREHRMQARIDQLEGRAFEVAEAERHLDEKVVSSPLKIRRCCLLVHAAHLFLLSKFLLHLKSLSFFMTFLRPGSNWQQSSD
jgi:hypothetical protein